MKSSKLFIFLLALFIVHSSWFTKFVSGADEFTVDSNVTYEVQESGKTLVSHEITLENVFSTLYATTYTLSLENVEVVNVQARSETGDSIPLSSEKQNEKSTIKVNFPDAVVGKGKQRHFFITYESSNLAVRTGEVWEISIPRLSDEKAFRAYQVTLKVSSKFGQEAYISPKPAEYELLEDYKSYKFSKNNIVKTGITAGFGEFQVFSFSLSYHLENPLNREAETQIAFPPDTAFQKVYYQIVNPTPINIEIDSDGNWLALYKLKARQRMDVNVVGSVQIFAGFRPFPKPTEESLNTSLLATSFWQVDGPEIRALAQKLKNPKDIYDYVSTILKYDYERVRPNVERLGAAKALKNPESAICMEFTDLFIALARAAGISAREINGYAYTENPKIQPLSLVNDVLHSWPEYYDREKGVWIPVDPTWASTTGGVDFFSKLDLRHFTFVIHGKDDSRPYAPGSYKLGSNPQKDVFVTFGQLPDQRVSLPEISAKLKKGLPFFDSRVLVDIKNPGPSSLTHIYPSVYFDGRPHIRDFLEILPPFSSHQMTVKVPFSFLGRSTPAKVKIEVDGSYFEVDTQKDRIVLSSLLTLFLVFVMIIVVTLVKFKRLRIGFLGDKIRLYVGKIRKSS